MGALNNIILYSRALCCTAPAFQGVCTISDRARLRFCCSELK